MDVKGILDEYRNADEGKRVGLFLAFRDLRDYFSSIEDESRVDLTIFNLPRIPWKRIEDRARGAWLHLREHFHRKACRAH